MAAAIQRLFVLLAFIAAGIAFVSPASASVAPLHPALAGIAGASMADADNIAAAPSKNKSPCARNADRSQYCPVCSKSIVLRSVNRTRTKVPGLEPRTDTGVPAYKQPAVDTELYSGILRLARLTLQQTDFSFGEILTRTSRLRI